MMTTMTMMMMTFGDDDDNDDNDDDDGSWRMDGKFDTNDRNCPQNILNKGASFDEYFRIPWKTKSGKTKQQNAHMSGLQVYSLPAHGKQLEQ